MKVLLATFAMMGFMAVSHAVENMSADAQAVDSACSQDATTAGCSNEKVGTGLLKCMHAYKKAHHDFKFSGECKTAMQKMKADHKATH